MYTEKERTEKIEAAEIFNKILAKNGWYPCSGSLNVVMEWLRLPSTEGMYKVVIKGGEITEAYWNSRKEIFTTGDGGELIAATYWKKKQ